MSKTLIKKILSAERCGDLFEQDEQLIRATYRNYSKIIHPDICDDPQAPEATMHLNKLYESALEHISEGTWDKSGSAYIAPKLVMGAVQDVGAFELGARYVNPSTIIYVFNSGKQAYFDRYLENVKNIQYKDDRMKTTYMYRMPHVKIWSRHISLDRSYIAISKQSSEYPMDLFLKAYQERLTWKDIAWMISRMIDLCCFLNVNNLVLNGFAEENLFINPDNHSIHIYGGWWYAGEAGTKDMIGTCNEVYSVMTSKNKTDHINDPLTDIESIRAISRRLIEGKTDIPEPLMKWINAGSSNDPIEEYSRWNNALDDGRTGPRHFTVFNAKPEEIYTQKRS